MKFVDDDDDDDLTDLNH